MAQAYISKVSVDLWKQEFWIQWSDSVKKEGPYHCTPGRGIHEGIQFNCNDVNISRGSGTACTPKGVWPVLDYDKFWAEGKAEWVTRFQSIPREIGIHDYPDTPQYPASGGCVRVKRKDIAKLIYDKTKKGKTIIEVAGELRPNILQQPGEVFQQGDNNFEVEKLQKRLSEVGVSIVVDGDFGPGTEKAVKLFQRQAGLSPVDGIIGTGTYHALFSKQRVPALAQ